MLDFIHSFHRIDITYNMYLKRLLHVGSRSCSIFLHEVESDRVVKVKKGDVLAVPKGIVSWWFNENPLKQLEILFLGV